MGLAFAHPSGGSSLPRSGCCCGTAATAAAARCCSPGSPWRASCSCGRAEGTIDRTPAVIACAILVAAAVASFDRAAAVELVLVGILFAVRVPKVRAVIAWTAAVAAVTAAVALVIAGPSAKALERHLRH